MSMFSQYTGNGSFSGTSATESLVTPPVASAEDQVVSQEVDQQIDQTDAGFEQERQQVELNADAGVTQGDTDTNVDLPEGEFGDDADKKESGNDVTVDADDTETAFDNEMDASVVYDQELDQEELAIEQLMVEMGQLAQTSVAIESFGIDKSSMAIMQITGLLHGTALESLGLESVTASAGDQPESQMALEAIGEKIKEKAAAFSAKVLHVIKSGGEKVMGVLTPMWDSITETSKKLTASAWDATKSAGAAVKAHPYKTIAAVVTAIAVVAGIVAFVAGAPAMGAKADVLKNFLAKIVGDINSKLKFPGGAVSAKLNDAGTKIVLTMGKAANAAGDTAGRVVNAAEAAGVKALGWSQPAVKAIESQLGRAWSALKTGFAAMSVRATKLGTSAASTAVDFVVKPALDAGMAAGNATVKATVKAGVRNANGLAFARGAGESMAIHGYMLWVSAVLVGVFQLVRFVVVGGFRMIAATFRALTGQTAAA